MKESLVMAEKKCFEKHKIDFQGPYGLQHSIMMWMLHSLTMGKFYGMCFRDQPNLFRMKYQCSYWCVRISHRLPWESWCVAIPLYNHPQNRNVDRISVKTNFTHLYNTAGNTAVFSSL